MNIIEVMQLPIGTEVTSTICNGKTIKVCEQDGVKVLKFKDDFKRIFLDNEVTEATYKLVKDNKPNMLTFEQTIKMPDKFFNIDEVKKYTLDIEKINNLEDVKKILESMIELNIPPGITSSKYEKLKHYLKQI